MIISKTLLLAEMEHKSITAQRVMEVVSLLAFELAQCLFARDMTNISFLKKLENLLPLLVCSNRKHRATSFDTVINLVCYGKYST